MKKSLFLATFIFVFACASFALSPIAPEVPVNESNNGEALTVYVGQTLTVSLSENPSTGYRWCVEDFKPKVLEQLETIFKPAGSNPGTGGTKIFGFLARRVGETKLELAYQRPWAETVAPEKTFSLKLKVIKASPPPDLHYADSRGRVGTINLGITLSALSKALEPLADEELNETSVVEFRPGEKKEYLGFILITDGKKLPKCPNEKLPMTNKALKNMVGKLLGHYGKKAGSKVLGFTTGGFVQPGYAGVTLVGTGLELFFEVQTGEPMGKLTGKL